jgi:anti-anti-sigma factor
MEEITTRREGTIDVVEVLGELDMSNVHALDEAIEAALSDQTTSCLIDLSQLSFLDSTVVKALIRWSNDAQLSEREALAIVVGEHTPAERVFELVGLTARLPIFKLRAAAHTALVEGQRARTQRTLKWLTDAELSTARSDAQAASDAATCRLGDIAEEEHNRRAPTQAPPTHEASGDAQKPDPATVPDVHGHPEPPV